VIDREAAAYWIPAFAGMTAVDLSYALAIPKPTIFVLAARLRPSFANRPPSITRGCGEGRVLVAPMVRVQKKARGRTTGDGPNNRPSLHDGLTAYTYSPRCAGLVSHRRRRDHRPSNLAPASGRQDHTTSPSCPGRSSARETARANPDKPSHPALNVRDDRETPLSVRRDARTVALIYEKQKSYFGLPESIRVAIDAPGDMSSFAARCPLV
jgi:hypothetical protein